MRGKNRSAFTLLCAFVLVMSGNLAANAAPLFQMPFPCGQAWRAATYTGHKPSELAVDINWGSGNDDLGKLVVASAAGTVRRYDAGTNSYGRYIVIDHGGDWSTLYAHLNTYLVADGATVTMGQQIGTVGNNDGALLAHLHYEQRFKLSDQSVKWNGSGIQYSYGQPGITYTSQNCGAPTASFSRDFDGDAKADLVTRDSSGVLHLYSGNGSNGFMSPTGGTNSGPGWNAFTAIVRPGDWDGDGKPDIITRDSAGYLHLYSGDGNGKFLAATGKIFSGGGWNPFNLIVGPGDWDGDGKADLIGRYSDGTMRLYRGNGSGGFIAGTGAQIGGGGWNPLTAIVGPGDWDGDGKVDLVARFSDGTMHLYRGNGTNGFQADAGKQIGGGGWNAFTSMVGPGDWNKDGYVDLVSRANDGTMHLYKGNGAGGFISGTGDQIGGGGWNAFNLIL